jgi:hypothetical protein
VTVEGDKFEVGVGSFGRMWRKRVDIERRTDGRWSRLRSVLLTETLRGVSNTIRTQG